MNVAKIQGLSEQHDSLKNFHTVCTHHGVELEIKETEKTFGNVILGYSTTASIITELRHILLRRMVAIEQDIIREAH
ncbi:unnamed protein product [marine sediment metagenome]|uniref:Uncharacterized protein n=1 Tax=marine sediment metagenome TaxID=412755 RepID=X1AX27_9ZZZZ